MVYLKIHILLNISRNEGNFVEYSSLLDYHKQTRCTPIRTTVSLHNGLSIFLGDFGKHTLNIYYMNTKN